MAKELKPSYSYFDNLLNKLKTILPEVFEDGEINTDKLKDVIGEQTTDYSAKEHFELTWPGKYDARKMAAKPPTGTLRPCTPKDKDGGSSKNIFIEGENLEVLKILRLSYSERIGMIYIDPPYNTGKDHIYEDNFADSTEDYLRKSGQQSDEGLLVSNPKSSARFHAKWLSFMYPRLRVAKDLMKSDGMIFVSIGDDEVDNLRLLMDEIFGEDNFIASLIWNTEGHTDNQFQIKVNHEYVLLYAKNKHLLDLGYVIDPNTREQSNLRKGYAENSITKNGPKNPPSEIVLPVGFPCKAKVASHTKTNIPKEYYEEVRKQGYISREITRKFSVSYPIRKNSLTVENYALSEPCPVFSGWANADKLQAFIENGCKPVLENDNTELTFFLSQKGVIYYRRTRDKARNIVSVLRNVGTTEQMRSELESDGIYFSYPKPKQLISYLVDIAGLGQDDIILDFFAGSNTTAHVVLDKIANGLDLSFITVQLDVQIPKEDVAYAKGFRKISELSEKRIVTAINNLKSQPLFQEQEILDKLSYKKFRQSGSNIFKWKDFEPSQDGGIKELSEQLQLALQNPLMEQAKPEDIITEILLQIGFPLSAKQQLIKGEIARIYDPTIPFDLYICTSTHLETSIIEKLGIGQNDYFVCLDLAFQNDSAKQSLDNRCRLFTI